MDDGFHGELLTKWKIANTPHPRSRDGASTSGTHPCNDDDDNESDGDGDDDEEEYDDR